MIGDELLSSPYAIMAGDIPTAWSEEQRDTSALDVLVPYGFQEPRVINPTNTTGITSPRGDWIMLKGVVPAGGQATVLSGAGLSDHNFISTEIKL